MVMIIFQSTVENSECFELNDPVLVGGHGLQPICEQTMHNHYT